jgi:hypothetical protein
MDIGLEGLCTGLVGVEGVDGTSKAVAVDVVSEGLKDMILLASEMDPTGVF